MPYPASTSSPLNYVGIGKQSSKGTGVTPTLFVPYRGAVTLDHAMAGDAIYEAGTGPYANRNMKTAHDPTGQFGLGARPSTIATLMAWFLGADAVAGSNPTTHTTTPAPSNRVWLSVEEAAGTDGDIIERFVDAVLTTATVTIDGNQDVMATFGWTSLTDAWIATAATPTYESGVNGSTPGANFRASDVTYTVDGSGETNVAMLEVSLEWKYDGPRLSKITRGDLLKLELSGKVKLKQLLDNNATRDAYRKINYGSASGTVPGPEFFGSGALIFLADNGLTTTNEREFGLTIPAIDWTSAKYTDLDPAGATIYVEREGTIKKGASAFVTATAKTADASAYV